MDAFVFPVNLCMQPIDNTLTVFTDGSSNGKAAYVIGSHVHSLEFLPASAQIIVLHAVAAVFEMLKNQAFNLYTDSQYIAHGLQLLEIVPFLDTANSQILQLFMHIQLKLRENTVSLKECPWGGLQAILTLDVWHSNMLLNTDSLFLRGLDSSLQ